MRKGPGLSALSRHSNYSNSYSSLSNTISTKQLNDLQSSLESFKETLIEFSLKHRKDIKNDPGFRFQFQKMCSILGIDPLIGSTSRSDSGGKEGLWGMLGISEWEYELTVQVVDISVSTRVQNGGLISLHDLINRVERLRNGGRDKSSSGGGGEITESDIIRSIKILEPLKSGYKIHSIGPTKYLRTIPKELNTDQSILLSIAATTGGKLTKREIKLQTNWTNDRINLGLMDCIMEEGLGWLDEQASNDTGDSPIQNNTAPLTGIVSGMSIGNEVKGDVWIIAATTFLGD